MPETNVLKFFFCFALCCVPDHIIFFHMRLPFCIVDDFRKGVGSCLYAFYEYIVQYRLQTIELKRKEAM